MFKKLRSAIQEILAYSPLWALIPGSALMGLVAGYVTYITEVFRAFAPASWLFGGLLGAALFMCIVLAWVKARQVASAAAINERFHHEADRINPLQNTFENRRILISDLVPPVGVLVEGKTFIECEIVGPANIVFVDGCTLEQSSFSLSDMILIADNRPSYNVVGFKNCRFLRCQFFKITLLVGVSGRGKIEAGFNGKVPWLNAD